MIAGLKLCAAIVTYNRYDELGMTIKSIHREGIPYENILVIDNNSDLKTYGRILNDFPGIDYRRLETNISSAGGFALAMQTAVDRDYDWIWLFNDDSRPRPGALNSLHPYLVTSAYPILQISTLDEKGLATILQWKGVRKPIKVSSGSSAVPSDLVTFDGAIIRTDVIRTIGTCDPRYFMGTYEFDFCLRARDAGFSIATIPNGLMEDQKLGSVGGLPPWREYYNTRNHLWLGLNRRSAQIIFAFVVRELKFIAAIILYRNNKLKRLLFKYRAVRDALIGRRGKTYFPQESKG